LSANIDEMHESLIDFFEVHGSGDPRNLLERNIRMLVDKGKTEEEAIIELHRKYERQILKIYEKDKERMSRMKGRAEMRHRQHMEKPSSSKIDVENEVRSFLELSETELESLASDLILAGEKINGTDQQTGLGHPATGLLDDKPLDYSVHLSALPFYTKAMVVQLQIMNKKLDKLLEALEKAQINK